jgi:hypothetical protein
MAPKEMARNRMQNLFNNNINNNINTEESAQQANRAQNTGNDVDNPGREQYPGRAQSPVSRPDNSPVYSSTHADKTDIERGLRDALVKVLGRNVFTNPTHVTGQISGGNIVDVDRRGEGEVKSALRSGGKRGGDDEQRLLDDCEYVCMHVCM